MTNPFTLNVLTREASVLTYTFPTRAEAERTAYEHLRHTDTAHVTVTHEPSGRELIDWSAT